MKNVNASRIKRLRESRNISQEKLAEKIGISKSAISMYEQGGRIAPMKIQEKIADFFGVSLDYLWGRKTETKGCSAELTKWLEAQLASKDKEQVRKIRNIINEVIKNIWKGKILWKKYLTIHGSGELYFLRACHWWYM